MSERLTHGSLFSGIGGPEIAAEIMGWKNVFHCEINPFGRKILDYWFPNSKSYEDITKTDFREWQGKINVLTGGFPCQPFSCAGQRKGAEDDRYLWPEMLRAIREIQPDWVVGENVAGILTMVQPGSETALGREESLFGEVDRERTLHRQEYVVETVCNDLEREGYSVQPVVIPACAVGAPHRRDRVWFIAKRAATDSTDAGTETVQRERKDGVLSDKYVTHTDGKKLQKRLETGRRTDEAENRARMDNGIERFGSLRNAPYSSSEGLSTLRFPTSIEKKKRENEDGCSVQPAGNVRRTPFAERWENFPTQSPVCSRDDGIFTGLDGIAFSKWRQESIKAYGNAIVPQVMYEIFLAIESIEKGK
ncbi:MAG: DNA (cytosine-5-)-methyltransferase [Bacteroides uniformis]|nr:DNA (cytosine-5-)-methyltransferase [Bacteroides uniformis]